MNLLKKIWNFLDGKKLYIGIGLHTGWFITNLVFPKLTNPEEAIVGHGLIGTITGVGAGHKIMKAKINKSIDDVQKK